MFKTKSAVCKLRAGQIAIAYAWFATFDSDGSDSAASAWFDPGRRAGRDKELALVGPGIKECVELESVGLTVSSAIRAARSLQQHTAVRKTPSSSLLQLSLARA
jgi:hypothetical protein